MKRWNSWGNENSRYSTGLGEGGRQLLEALLGPATALPVATLDEVVAKVPASKMPEHPLIDTDAELRVRHARGQSLPDHLALCSGELGAFPDGVALPESAQQVRELLEFAVANDIVVIPYGGGTSVVGHINPAVDERRPVLTVSMARMNQMLALDQESQLATFGAGAAGPQLEEELQTQGYTLGHFPQSWELSTVGGWVASRSSGQQSLRYGRIEQMFAGGIMETPAGPLEIPTFPASSAGPDMREIVLGSEGRMGIITEVKVRVTPLPERESFHVAFFPDWDSGVRATRELAQGKVQLSMVRLSNVIETASLLAAGNEAESIATLNRELEGRGVGAEKVMLTYGVTGGAAQCTAARALATEVLSRHGGIEGPDAFGARWEHGRFSAPYLREVLWALGYFVDTMETAVDWSRVTPSMHAIEGAIGGALADEQEKVVVYSHLSHVYGQGSSIYTTYLCRCAESYDATYQRWKKLKAAGARQIVAAGGTISHQHGVGADHREYLPAEKGALGISAIRTLCALFDPKVQLNPGKLLPDE